MTGTHPLILELWIWQWSASPLKRSLGRRRLIQVKSSQFLFKLTQNINEYKSALIDIKTKDCEEGKEIFQFLVHCA